MTIQTDKQVVRVRLSGMTCRSKERLLNKKLPTVTGVVAGAVDETVLTALVDPDTIDVDGLITAIIASGLVPEEVLTTRFSLGGDNAR